MTSPITTENPLDQLSPEQQDRLTEILDQYLEQLERGEHPGTKPLLEAHPDLADVLSIYLRSLGVLHGATRDLSHQGESHAELRGPAKLPIQLGDYRILREIGRGGMGIVYRATQLSLQRQVALKILPLSGTLDTKQTERFRREAQAAAQLQHPHIVPVFDVGSDQGIPYYSMQLIEGFSLDDLIREQQQQAAAPTRTIGSTVDDQQKGDRHSTTNVTKHELSQSVQSPAHIERVARWFLQAAEALQHAHDIGVIHRDIKPSNLLIDRTDHLWITDFGLAHIQSESRVTITGELIGTLRYMSPEQAQGSPLLDHRTDLYSLGITCYELLTHRVAFEGGDRHRLLQQIGTADPIPPRRINRSIPADLETILQKSIAKDPQDRYVSARALAADLQAFLHGKPIQARRPSWLDRSVKWVQRHRVAAASGLAVMVVALVASLASAWNISQRNREIHRLFAQAQRVGFHQIDLAEHLVTVDGVEPLVHEMLAESLRYYQEFVVRSGRDPAMRNDLAAAHYRIGRISEQLGSTDEARAAYRESLNLYRQLPSKYRTAEAQTAEALCHNSLGLLATRDQQLVLAAKHYRAAQQSLEALAAHQPKLGKVHDHLATILGNLGLLAQKEGRTSEAHDALDRGVALRKGIRQAEPENWENQLSLATLFHNLSHLELSTPPAELAPAGQAIETERLAKAEEYCRMARELQQQVHEKAPSGSLKWKGTSDLALGWNNQGAIAMRRSDPELAVQAYQQAIELGNMLISECPGVPQHRLDLAITYNNMAQLHAVAGRWGDADRAFHHAVDVAMPLTSLHAKNPQVRSCLAGTLHNQAMALKQSGELQQAVASLDLARQHAAAALEVAPNYPPYVELLQRTEQAVLACRSQLQENTPR